MSVVIQSCFDHVVGYTRSECSCVDNTHIPADYDDSLSGLYIDELRGMDLIGLSEIGGCDANVWDMLTKNLYRAILSYRIDTMQEIMKDYAKRYKHFSGRIGSQDYENDLTIGTTYAGVRIACNPMKDGKIKLKKIGLLFDGAYTFTISLYNNRQAAALYSWSVTSAANTYTVYTLPVEVTLPLYDDDIDDLEYYLLYDPTGKKPKDNKVIECCSGSGWCFNLNNPCWNDTRMIKKRWQKYVMVGGTTGDVFIDRDEWATGNEMNGLTLDCEMLCDAFNILCDEDTDFETDPIDHSAAMAIWYKWGEYNMDSWLSSREINRETMTNREALIAYRDFYVGEYTKHMVFVAQNIDVNKNGCLHCVDKWGFQVKGDLRNDTGRSYGIMGPRH